MVMDTSFLHSPFFERVRAEGREEGEAVGRLKAHAEVTAAAIFRILLRRGVAVSAENEKRIKTCTDLDALDKWLGNALTAVTIDDVFANS